MKDRFINYCLTKIKNKYPNFNKTKMEEIKYGLESLYLTITKLIVLIFLALVLNIVKEFLLFLIFYNLVRMYSFGLHATKSYICLITSIIMFIGFPFLAKYIVINKYIISIFGIILLLNFYKYSPADTRKRPIVNPKVRLKYKYLSCITVIIFLFISLFVKNTYISNLLFLSVFLQALLINPYIYKLFGLSYDNYKNYHI